MQIPRGSRNKKRVRNKGDIMSRTSASPWCCRRRSSCRCRRPCVFVRCQVQNVKGPWLPSYLQSLTRHRIKLNKQRYTHCLFSLTNETRIKFTLEINNKNTFVKTGEHLTNNDCRKMDVHKIARHCEKLSSLDYILYYHDGLQ